ncbi:MAG: hypothetical protein IH845_05235 [Nanoarchaeota archaeon]|nr:hypothetical protein [Nanoarchaeota archaeon]
MENKMFLYMFVIGLFLISFASAFVIDFNPDITPPIISNIQVNWIDKNMVNISWDTDEPSYFNQVMYGKGRKYDHEVFQQFNTNLTSIMIPQPSILLTINKQGNYHYKIQSCDLFGNCASSSDYKIKK